MVKVREDLPLIGTVADPFQSSQTLLLNFDLDSWLARLIKQLEVNNLDTLKRACELVQSRLPTFYPQSRANPYITGIGMADILAHLHVDEVTLVAALLFRAAREELITQKEIEQQFGQATSRLVYDVLAMWKLSELIESSRNLEEYFRHSDADHLSNIYKMLVAVTQDVRAVLIKLAERTFALRDLAKAPADRQERVAREVLTIYAPLAHRLGIAQLKWELEDLAFRYVAPERYKEIARLLNEKRTERDQYISNMITLLQKQLADYQISAEITGRAKHIYSIYRKMKGKQLSFEQLYDVSALRVLVQTIPECYQVLGVVHQIWRHIPHQFDDYITNPKTNGYRSLHTAVIAEKKSLEIQIRTQEMHFEAELGVCAHFNYKEGLKRHKDQHFNQKLNTLRLFLDHVQPSETQSDEESEEDLLPDWGEFEKIYVFTKDGDIKELPKDATVLDFAYHIHTQVGNACYAARVNERFVPLNYVLQTGEQVEVLTRKGREPSRDWLMASLGYVRTSKARNKLKHWFRIQDRSKNLEIGRDVFTKALARLAIHPNSIDLNEYARLFNVKTADDVLIGLVTGDISLTQLINHINRQLQIDSQTEQEFVLKPAIHPKKQTANVQGILLEGLDQVDIHMAQCCQPVHNELIGGYITHQRGVSIHKTSCIEFQRLQTHSPERIIEANWEMQPQQGQLVHIIVEAYDRRGLLKDLTQIIFADQINISQVNTLTASNGIATMQFQVEVKGLAQLSRLLAKLEHQPGVLSSRRQIAN